MSESTTSFAFTDQAARKVKSLIDEEENPNLNLRIYISGGGCSGFQYGFTFDEVIQDDDRIIEKKLKDQEHDQGDEGGFSVVRLLIDPISYPYLEGAEIDYREDERGCQFVVKNPNAKTTCGCGSSFST